MTGLTREDLIGPERFNPIMRVRLAVYKVAADWKVHSFSMIGAAIGGRDHSTVINGTNRAEAFMDRDADFAALVAKLKAACLEADPFLANEQNVKREIVIPVSRVRKCYSPLRPIISVDMDETDAGRVFHENIAKGSNALADALARARAA